MQSPKERESRQCAHLRLRLPLPAAGLNVAKTGMWGTVFALDSSSHPARKWYIDDNIIKMNRVGWVQVLQSFLEKCFKEIINSDIAYML